MFEMYEFVEIPGTRKFDGGARRQEMRRWDQRGNLWHLFHLLPIPNPQPSNLVICIHLRGDDMIQFFFKHLRLCIGCIMNFYLLKEFRGMLKVNNSNQHVESTLQSLLTFGSTGT